VNPHAAGVDIGSEEIWVCVPEDREAEPVRPFGPLTPDLYALADWLATCRIAGSGTQVMLATQFRAIVGQKRTHKQGGQQQP
jgi:hypothetical protein